MDFSLPALSNIGFLMVGLYLICINRRQPPSYRLLFGPLAIAVGTSSFIYHLHPTFTSKLIDISVIFLFLSFLVMINLYRMRLAVFNTKRLIELYLVCNLTTIILLYLTHLEAGVWLFVAFVVLIALTEFFLFATSFPRPDLILFVISIVVLAVAWQLRMIESVTILGRTVIISGHALWHGTVSICFLLIYYFHRQMSRK